MSPRAKKNYFLYSDNQLFGMKKKAIIRNQMVPFTEGTGSNCTREQCALIDVLDPVPVCFLQLVSLVDKRYL